VRGIILNSFLEKAVTVLPGKINCGCVSGALPNPISQVDSLNIFRTRHLTCSCGDVITRWLIRKEHLASWLCVLVVKTSTTSTTTTPTTTTTTTTTNNNNNNNNKHSVDVAIFYQSQSLQHHYREAAKIYRIKKGGEGLTRI
jgi:hypothetical protein